MRHPSQPTTTIQLMAEYNQSMNNNLYSAAATLSPATLAEDRGAFFGSIIATLNHILVGDTIWLQRFAQHPFVFNSLDPLRQLDTPASLSTILHDELDALYHARVAMDNVIITFAAEMPGHILSSQLTYSNTQGKAFTKNMAYLIQHLFNHQTHHRGQVSTLLSQLNVDIGTTDLLMNIPDE